MNALSERRLSAAERQTPEVYDASRMAKRVDRFSQIVLSVFTRMFGPRLRRQQTTHRGAPCACGSGLKYKRCCLQTARGRKNSAVRKPN